MDAPVPKRFSWSWSRLKNYRTCPKRHYEVDIAKNYSDEGSEAIVWGKSVHDAMQKRIERPNFKLPPTMTRYEEWPSRVRALKDAGLDVMCENKMAMDKDFGPTSFFDPSTWFRAVIDVKILIPEIKAAITIDWKTGQQINPEYEQLALSAQVMFAHHPDLEQIACIYVWFGHDEQTIKVYRRSDLASMWGDVLPTVKQMTEAHRTLTYEPKPSGLCKRHCPVTSCPHHGKGSR